MSNIAISEIPSTATKIADNDLLLVSKYNGTNLNYTSAKVNAGLFQRFVTQDTVDFTDITYYNNNVTGSSIGNGMNFPTAGKVITFVEGTGHVIEDFTGTYNRSSDKSITWANSDTVEIPFDCYIWVWSSGQFGSKNGITAEDRDTQNGYGSMNVSLAVGTDSTTNFFDVARIHNDWARNSTAIFPLKKGNRFRFEMDVSSYYNTTRLAYSSNNSIPIKVPSFTYNYRFIPVQ